VDFAHLSANLPEHIVLTRWEDRALWRFRARSVTVMARLSLEAAALPFMGVADVSLDGIDCLVSRSDTPERTVSRFPSLPVTLKPREQTDIVP